MLTEAHEVFPSGVFMSELNHAVGLHEAVCELILLRNRQTTTHYPEMSEEMLRQRAGMLELNTRLVINSRDAALDKICSQWCASRGIKVG